MKNFLNNTNYFKIIFILLIVYFVYTFILQQKTLISYANDKKQYDTFIAIQKELKEDLLQTKQNVDSKEYIERIAREKLDMYLPNEKVYIDKEK